MKKILTVTLLIAVFVLSCDNDTGSSGGGGTPSSTPETPKAWTDETIAGITGLKISTMSGTQLTPTQMNTIKSKLKTAIEAVRDGDDMKPRLNLIDLLDVGLLVELETTTEYNQYYVSGGRFRLNANHAINTLDGVSFGAAVNGFCGIGQQKL
jgi:hypothetical protein